MTSSANSQQVHAVLKNTLRFVWNSTDELMERKIFGQAILFGALCLKIDDLLCLQKNATDKYYDVTFYTVTKMEEVKGLALRLADGLLKNFRVLSLCRTGERIVTVHIYNPWVSEEATRYFLARYVTVLTSMGDIKDVLGIWTGKRQFRVMLKEDPNGYDGFCHPPATFTIGSHRGFLVYGGQPLYCRQCASYGHLARSCRQVRCRNCDSLGHTMRNCDQPKKCSLCGLEGHLFGHCPEVGSSYARAARRESVAPGAQHRDGPACDDPRSTSLRAIEDVIAELTGGVVETKGADAPEVVSVQAESEDAWGKQGGEAESLEEASSVIEWVAGKKGGKSKRKRAKTSLLLSPPSSPLLVEANRFGVLVSEVWEEMQEGKETGQVHEITDNAAKEGGSAAAAVDDCLESEEAGEALTQKGMTASSSSKVPASGVPGEPPCIAVFSSDAPPAPRSCPVLSEDSPSSSECSFPLKEPDEEDFLP